MQTSLLTFFGGGSSTQAGKPQKPAILRKAKKRDRKQANRLASSAPFAARGGESNHATAAVTNSKKQGPSQSRALRVLKEPIEAASSPNQTIEDSNHTNSGVLAESIASGGRRASSRRAAAAASAKLAMQASRLRDGDDALNTSVSSESIDPEISVSPAAPSRLSRAKAEATRRRAPSATTSGVRAASSSAKTTHVRHASLTGWRSCLDQTVARRRRVAPCMWDVSHVASVDVGATHETQGVNAYTMSFLNNGTAVATGGQHGLVSIAYIPPGARGGSQFAPPDGELPLCEGVVQWAAHDRWVSDVRQPDGASALLTSSDDGTVAVWGIPSPSQCSEVWSPPLLDKQTLHDAGVYSCDAATRGSAEGSTGFYAISGSKDSSVNLCSVDAAGKLQPVRRWSDAHSGVVKCVRWRRDRAANTFASCGNDKAVRIWDTRCSAASLHVPDAHSLSVNTVTWSPCGTYVMSGSFDNTLKLWDCRATGKALLSAPTVTGSTSERSSSIIHPAFFMGGRVILVPLPKLSCVWTLDALTGKPLPAGEDGDGKLEVVAEDLPVPPSCMAVSEDSGFSSGSRRKAGLLIATNHNRRSQVWEVMGQTCC